MENEKTMTTQAEELMDTQINRAVAEGNEAYATYTIDEMKASLEDDRHSTTLGYILRRFIRNNRPDLLADCAPATDEDPTLAFDEETVNIVAKRIDQAQNELMMMDTRPKEPRTKDLSEADKKKYAKAIGFSLYQIKGISLPSLRKILRDEPGTASYAQPQLYLLGFALRMRRDDMIRVFLANNSSGYNMHTADGLAAWYCQAGELFTQYGQFLALSEKISTVLQAALPSDAPQSEQGTATATRMIRQAAENRNDPNIGTKSDSEKMEDYVNDIRANAAEVCRSRFSESQRRLVDDILDDIFTLARKHMSALSSTTDIKDFTQEDEEAKRAATLRYLLSPILVVEQPKKKEEGKEKAKWGTNPAKIPMPGDIGSMLTRFGINIKKAASDKENQQIGVQRSVILLLGFFLASEYIQAAKDENVEIKRNEIKTINGNKQDDLYDIALAEEDDGLQVQQRKYVLIDIVNEFFSLGGYMKFYLPNRIDRLVMMAFLSEDPQDYLAEAVMQLQEAEGIGKA